MPRADAPYIVSKALRYLAAMLYRYLYPRR